MKKVFVTLLAVGAVTAWLGCSKTEAPKPVAQQAVEESATDATSANDTTTDTTLVTVTLSVPHMV